MKKRVSLFVAIALGFSMGLTSCNPDEPDDPQNNDNEVFVSTTPQTPNVLVEELTGIGCQYCPDGHKLCDSLVEVYNGRFYSINIHTGGYAAGKNPDYTTPEGDTLRTWFGVSGYPNGYVNRIVWRTSSGNTIALGRGYFPSCADMIISGSTSMGNAYANVAAKATINKSTRELKVKVQVYYTGETTDTTAVHVAIVQNGLKSAQSGAATWYPEHYDAATGMYTHYHMLRKLLNGPMGDVIENKGVNTMVTKTYVYTIPETLGNGNIEAVLENLEVMAFITTNRTLSNGKTYPYPIINVCKSSLEFK
ncbi:MAG: Omp28-related outer membrane protein [Bacteroidales bacterium]|nr:Omp28-related outer membrane protein [Bacteroidales bacterium]